MNLIVLGALLALATAGSVEKSIVISTPEKTIVISHPENHNKNELSDNDHKNEHYEHKHHEDDHLENKHHEHDHREQEHHEQDHREQEHHEQDHREQEHHEQDHRQQEHHEQDHREQEHHEQDHREQEHHEYNHREQEHHEHERHEQEYHRHDQQEHDHSEQEHDYHDHDLYKQEHREHDYHEHDHDEQEYPKFSLKDSQYWPQDNAFHVAQFITYQFYQAQQHRYTAADITSHLTKQGFSEFVIQYLTNEYESFKTEPKLPYEIFQYYFEHGMPKDVQIYISLKIDHAHKHYLQYLSKNEQHPFEQGVSQSVADYVTNQTIYYMQRGISYPIAQYALYQLQQAYEYAKSALEILERDNTSHEIYQSLIEHLQKAQKNALNAKKVYEEYETYQQYYVPYYAAKYFFQQVQEAYHHLDDAYQYIQRQDIKGKISTNSIVKPVKYAYQAAAKAFRSQPDSMYFKSSIEFPFDYTEYVAHHIQQALQYGQQVEEMLQKVAKNSIPQSTLNYILEQFKQGQTYAKNAYLAYEFKTTQNETQLIEQALQFFQNVYQAMQPLSFDTDIIKYAEFTLQHLQNAYFAALEASYQRYNANHISLKPVFARGYNLTYYKAIQKVQEYIQNASQYIGIHDNISEASFIAQKLAKASGLYKPALHLLKNGYLPQSIYQYVWQQVQEATQYLSDAYQAARLYELLDIVEKLKYALDLAQYFQFTKMYQAREYTPSLLTGYPSNYESEYEDQTLQQPVELLRASQITYQPNPQELRYGQQPYHREQYYGQNYPTYKQNYKSLGQQQYYDLSYPSDSQTTVKPILQKLLGTNGQQTNGYQRINQIEHDMVNKGSFPTYQPYNYYGNINSLYSTYSPQYGLYEYGSPKVHNKKY